MGLRGPSPLPTKVLEMRGSWRAKNRAGTEPAPRTGYVHRPKWLDGEGAAAWKNLAPQLAALGILSRIYANALARYCELWARWRAMRDFIAKRGEVYPVKNRKGEVVGFKTFPQAKLLLALSDQLTRIEAQFGLTPSARARLSIELSGAPSATDNLDEGIFRLG